MALLKTDDQREPLVSWIVLVSSWLCQAISGGIAFSSGLYHKQFLDHFQESNGSTAWISSLHTGVLFSGGPLASLLINKYGCRAVLLLGSVVGTVGLLISTLATNIYYLYASYGVVAGFGVCLVYIPSALVVAPYFSRRRNFALGFASSGFGVGNLIFPSILQTLVSSYGWRGALIITSGLFLQTLVLGSLMRPQSDVTTTSQNRTKAGDNSVKYNDRGLLRNKLFYILWMNNFLWNVGSLILFVMFVDYATVQTISQTHATVLLSIVGVANTIGRILASLLNSCKKISRMFLYISSNILSGFAIAMVPFNSVYSALGGCAAMYGLFFGIQLGTLAIVTSDMFGMDNLATAYGYLMLANGLGAMLGPPCAGWLFDLTTNHDVGFYFGGGLTILSGLMMLSIPFFQRQDKKKLHETKLSKESQIKIIAKDIQYDIEISSSV